MAASDTASLDKKLESLPLPVLQQIVARHSIVLSEADARLLGLWEEHIIGKKGWVLWVFWIASAVLMG